MKMLKGISAIISFVIILLGIICTISAQSRCKNPNNRNGYCIDIRECPTLKGLLAQKPLSNDDLQFVRESECINGYGRPPYVCCTEDTGYTNGGSPSGSTSSTPTSTSSQTSSQSNGRGNVLPTSPTCGTEPTANRIYNGNETALDEFPWMALLEYRTRSGKILNCAGSLINQRYVLTAAHCVTGRILKEVGPLITVRLGEHDITKDRDCIDTDCADPIIEVGIEETVPHENFSDESEHRHNDIALIRLNRVIRYTDFVKPVCLPSTLNLQKSQTGTDVVVAGWGRTLQARQSSTKQKLRIPIADQQQCAQKFATRNINIIDSQLCAGGQFAQDTCDGDSGGPLMKFTNKFWAIEGIVSFGNRCGLEGWPGVYTRVTSFENWIKENLKP